MLEVVLSSHKKQIKWSKVDSFIGNSSSDALTYHRPCPICGSLHSKVVLELNDFQFYSDSATSPKRVNVRENMCFDCFALYLNPCYSSYGFRILFEEAGQSYGSTEGRPQEQIDWLENRDRLKSGFSILDVGCYDGNFLARLPEGLRKMGVDIDGPAIERGRQRHGEQGIRFFLGDFETFKFDGPSPDTITMFHVLEHLPRPVEVLKNLRSISGPGTNLVVEVPILENGKTNDINGFFSVQHMTHFSRKSLANCLALGGWEVVEQIEQPDYNGCRVLAKPAAISGEPSEMVKANPDDAIAAIGYLENWYGAVKDAEEHIKLINPSKQIVIWGGGAHTEFLYQTTSFFQRYRHSDFLIVDSDPLKQGKTWRGITIFSPSMLADCDWAKMALVVSSYGGQESIASAAITVGVPASRVFRFYDSIRRY